MFCDALTSFMSWLLLPFRLALIVVASVLAVGWALFELGYKPVGIRLDSGDLAYLSRATKAMYLETDAKIGQEVFAKCQIVASNDLNEDAILGLNVEGHEITTFGIGTHLVTCLKTPALGCVYKLVEIHGQPRIKLSQEIEKLVIPGRKNIYRLIGDAGHPLVDVMQGAHEAAPVAGVKMLCRDPFSEDKRAMVKPTVVQELLKLVQAHTHKPRHKQTHNHKLT
jgi:nicotinate phosphoribosyltransferase